MTPPPPRLPACLHACMLCLRRPGGEEAGAGPAKSCSSPSAHGCLLLPPPSQLLESSDAAEDPTTFEVGAGDIVGNRLFEVRRLRVLLVLVLWRWCVRACRP